MGRGSLQQDLVGINGNFSGICAEGPGKRPVSYHGRAEWDAST